MAMYQLESDRIHSPKSLFLMGVAQELGVSMEFLLKGPPKENDPRELEEILKQSDIRFGLRALQKLDEQDRQTIISVLKRFVSSEELVESTSPLSG